MDIGRLIKDWKQIMLFACGFFALIYFLSTTSHFVTAFEETKRAHILPQNVTADGWTNPNNALSLNLSPDAPFGSFNQSNSAFVLLAAGSSSVPLQSSTGDGHAPGPTESPAAPPPAPESTTTTDLSPDIPQLLQSPDSSAPSSLPMPQVTTPADVPTVPAPSADTPSDVPTPPLPAPAPSLDAPTSMLEETRTFAFGAASRFFTNIADEALATTTGDAVTTDNSTTSEENEPLSPEEISSATPPVQDVEDVPTCSVLAIPCHTIGFSGFSVSGTITDKKFQSAEVNFSFGNRVPESEFADSKLQVRFYHNGQWKMAGEIFLNKELSNASNGSYFTANLDGITSWEDLSDVKVVFEFVRGDEHVLAAAYLDSVWIDAIYRERAQDILNGKAGENPEDTPDNVLFKLPNETDVSRALIMQSGSKIFFPYVSALGGDTLVIRSDKSSYKSADEPVYVSVTNTGKSDDSFRIFSSFPSGAGSVLEVSQYMKNVPTSATSSVTSDVTYLCDGGWKQKRERRNASSTELATSSTDYVCPSTREVHQCVWLNETGDNCKVSGVAVATSTDLTYGEDWITANQSLVPPQDSTVMDRLPPGYSVVSVLDQPVRVLAGQTLYFRIKLTSAEQGAKRFVLSAKGSRYFGTLDSVRLKNEEWWKTQSKTRKSVQRMRVNDELSEKNDFNVDELPSFHFKFKTQRSFFRRVFDNLAGRVIPYNVENAQLRHESGSIEHVPVEIEYGQNDEWTLRLKKGQRAFRPGKYTVELSMDEGTTPLSDSLEFYWGVIAINPDKSSYTKDDTVHFSVAALDDNGNTLCDALMQLTVTSPSGASQDVPVVEGGGCGHNNITSLPDYVADYSAAEVGDYTLTLSRLDSSGAIVNSITDAFTVGNASYVISREGPTRIYPVSTYPMRIRVTANQAFNGRVVESLPEGFTVPDTGGAIMTRENGAILLTWNMSLGEGESRDISYVFKAPVVTPYLFLAGPLTIIDNSTGASLFAEPRAWKIASDALSIATGVAWLAGNSTTNGTNLNSTTAYPISWTLPDDYDTTYFTHSTTTNASKLTVNVAGDYLVALTLPVERSDTTATRTQLESDIRVNGNKVNVGVGRSAFIRTTGGSPQQESSDHLYVLLRNLAVGDYIEADVAQLSGNTDTIFIGSQASLYAEFIDNSQQVYFGVGTTTDATTGNTNLNPTATSTMVWYDDATLGRKDSNYTHDSSSTSTARTVTLGASGDYLVLVNIPVNSTTANSSVVGRILMNGVMATGTSFRQGYIDGTAGTQDSSIHFSGLVHATTTNEKLSVTVLQDAAAGTLTVNGNQASLYIQQLPTTDVYYGRATTTIAGTDWSQAATTSVLWQADDIKDAGTYTHSTGVNASLVKVLKAGDYLAVLNDSHFDSSGTARVNTATTLAVNGRTVNGAETKSHFIRSTGGHEFSSGSMVFFLRNLNVNDLVGASTTEQAAAGTVTEDTFAQMVLWRKQAQSSFSQDTEWWYANIDNQTPDDPWPGGPGTLLEGDAITTGNAATSSTVLRLRMALKASVDTVAGADAFKLQYAAGSTCSPALTWIDVGAAGSGSIWRGYDNGGVTAGSTISTQLLSVSSTSETYEEQNPSATTPNGILTGKDGEWDWAIQDNGAPDGTSYCFRMVHSSGQVLKDYTDYPQLITNNIPGTPTLLTMFDNEKATTTSPWFTFQASDDNGDRVQYQIQVSTDPTFATTVIDADSLTNINDFENIQNTSDRTPFNSGEKIRYKATATLTNGTTYWWRVRAKDPNGANNYGSWATAYSFTIDTSVTVSTWFQTTTAQFANDTLSQLTATDTVMLTGANTTGTLWSQAITYSSHVLGNSWGSVTWSDQHVNGTILYQVEYFTSTSSWAIIPNADLAGNAAGTSVQPINLANLDPDTYGTIRIKANFTKGTASPVLNDWTVSWAYSVARPTLTALFDNEKTATTSPSFKFYTTDPQSDNLVYQIQWSTDSTFVSGVTSRVSDTDAGFSNLTNTGNTSPFTSGNTIQFKVQTADVLTNGTTYWWRVRAKDPAGGDAFSLWSTPRSFTVDTSVTQSTWFQTTSAQFTTDTLLQSSVVSGTVSGNTDVGKVAIYRAASAGNFIKATTFHNPFDTTVRQDDIYSMQYSSSSVTLKSGYYAVVYGMRFNATSTANRSEIQSDLLLASTTLPIGWSQAFIRRNGTANQGFSSGGGIIKVANDNDSLILQSFKTDTNPAATVVRAPNTAGISIVRLDSGWSYLRLSKTGTQVGPTNANWVSVTYDREDEVDTADFSHTSGSASINLKTTGHYLVFANTYGSLTTAVSNATDVDQRLIIDGTEVPGSYTTVFMQGNANADGDYQGAAALGMIIESTTTNQTLSVQVSRGAGTSAWKINADPTGAYVNRSAITIVKIPEGDFIRLQNTPSVNSLNPAATTTLPWAVEAEKDTASFTHSTGVNPSRVTSVIAGDYLFLTANFAGPGTTANANWAEFWEKNATVLTHAFSGGYNTSATSHVGAFSGIIMPSAINGDFFEAATKALGTAGNVLATKQGLQAVRISSLNEADTNPKSIESTDIVFANGDGPKWESISWVDSTPASTDIIYQVKYLTASSTYAFVPDGAGFGGGYVNSVGTTTSPIDISGLNRVTYGTLRLFAKFTCGGGSCPSLSDWTVKWNPGITVSGIARQYDQTTNVTSGTVNVAVNGVLSTKTGTIDGAGNWSITGVNAYIGDVVEVFVAGATNSSRAVAVTKYSGTGNITNMKLYQMHLTLGSDDQPFLTNRDIGMYDNTVSGNSAIFYSVVSNNLNVCAVTNCLSARLLVNSSTTYEPAANVTTPNIQIDGALFADGNTLTIGNSWKNNAAFFMGTSTVTFTATSTSETIDSSTATTSAFNIVTLGQTSGTATWSLSSNFNASSTFSIIFGTLKQGGANELRLSGDLTIGASGSFIRSSSNASTTFMGTATSTWTDSSATKQDMGNVVVLGSTKGLALGSNVKATNIINDGVIDASPGNFSIDILGNWTNNNSFMSRSGTVNFVATTTGKTIIPGSSNFYNTVFNGSGGNWAFSGNFATSSNDFTITAGTVNMPFGTTTIGGSFSNSGTFQHNNGAVLFNATASGKTITSGGSSFYDLNFNGSGGAWTFSGAATSSRNFIINAGTVTAPGNTMLTVAGSFAKNAGTFTHNNGTLRFTGVSSQTIKLNNSDAYNLTFNGVGGTWTFVDTNATSTATVTFQNGTTTLPSGSFAVGRDFTFISGGFLSNSGTVRLNATTTGFTINPGSSLFYNLLVDSSTGGWTMSSNSTTTNNTLLNAASNFTLSSGKSLQVLGQFTTAVATTSTTWTGSTLFLSATSTAQNSYSINTKGGGAATYGTLLVGTTTQIRMWNSSAATTTTLSGSSLYSQNNGAVSGALNIYGTYVRSSGTDYWSYANDFDGVVMGNQRAVTVRVATSSTLSLTGGTLNIVGVATASTTITNTGTNTYAWSISGGTLNAQYYQVRNTDTNGLSISGTPTISSMADGDFLVSTNGATTITIASTAINVNPLLQILRVKFATTTAITGYNVTETGSASSNWWFRSSYGNLTGENFDNDPTGPTGDPGPIQWDDSGFHINISGHVYSDHGTTAIGNPPCDGITSAVKIVTSIGLTYSTTCDGSGYYSVSNVSFPASAILYAYLDTGASGKHAVTITKSATVDITNFDLYQNSVVVRQEDVTPLTVADLAFIDATYDADIPYNASSTLIVKPDTELFVSSGNAFAPGATTTLQSGGSGSANDGRLYLATNAIFTEAGQQALNIGGGLFFDSGTTWNGASTTVTFTATTTGKSIQTASPINIWNLTFNGSGGQWSMDNGFATTTVTNALSMSAGTLVGRGDVVVATGGIGGSGTITMSGGMFRLDGTGSIGNSNPWQFYNLKLGTTTATTITQAGTATTTIRSILTIGSSATLNAGSSAWMLAGGGTPFVVSGTFNVQNAPWYYTATSSTNITATTYGNLTFAPWGSGTPTYTLAGTTFNTFNLTLATDTNSVIVNANLNDPSITVNGSVLIGAGSTFTASDIGALNVARNWTNAGTFTHSNATVLFNATTTGWTIDAGASNFYDLTFNGAGGWTVSQNASSTHNTTITNAGNFTLASGKALAVLGAFTNSVGGAATTWTGSILYLNSGTNYTIDTKVVGGDMYGTLLISTTTRIRSWNSAATTTTVLSGGSWYSMNNASSSGALSIYGTYGLTSGTDFWDYRTDFDGVDRSGSPRKVDVSIASSSSVTYSGTGALEIVGNTTASTTVQNQGIGAYSLSLSGASTTMQYFEFRNIDATGVNFSGSPVFNTFSNGDFLLSATSGSAITIASSVIDANPLKVVRYMKFATTSATLGGFNVTETGTPTTGQYWKFNLHYGNLAGEAFDVDPGPSSGDPGYVRWDNSNIGISVSGKVYSDEGTTVSTVCDNATPVVSLKVQGGGTFTSSCDSISGLYTILNVTYNPGDSFIVYLDTNGGRRGAAVSRDPGTNISDMDIYENRVIARNESATALSIADMDQYDSGQDADIAFTATVGSPSTLVLPSNTKLIVWTGKSFAPAGNITLNANATANAWDGTLEVFANGTFTASGNQTHTIGGSFIVDTNATFVSGNSTVTFNATTSGKTITPNRSSFYHLTFNGAGGNWAFSGGFATSTGNLTITAGTVTLPTGTTTVTGSFANNGGTIQHNNSTVLFDATTTGKTVRLNGSDLYNMVFNSSAGGWSFSDTNATTSSNFLVDAGTVTMPTGIFSIGSSMSNAGTMTANNGTVRFTSLSSGKTVLAGSSSFYNLLFKGVGGSWTMLDSSASSTRDFTVATGTVTLPSSLGVGGSFSNTGVFSSGIGAVTFNATTTGFTIDPGSSSFYNLIFNAAAGGWTVSANATSSNNTSLTSAASFTLAAGKTLAVQGTFSNLVGGAPTTWTNSTLYLTAGSYTINSKVAGGDDYGTILLGSNMSMRAWNSSAATTTVGSNTYLYSQNNGGTSGALSIYGTFGISSGSEYWSYATDFDGTALGGSSRQVNVKIATSSTVTLSGGTLNIVGVSTATTTVNTSGTSAYTFAISGGTFNALYYQFKGMDSNGLNFSGTPVIGSLDYGDMELSAASGTTMSLTGTVIDANSGITITGMRFASTSANTRGYNVLQTGSPATFWAFTGHTGNLAGEAFDGDGSGACGHLRWDDSDCQFVNEAHYRWRNDDGNEGALSSTWYNVSWTWREKIVIRNTNATAYTNLPVKIDVPYDSAMKSNFDDLRFTDSTGTTSIPFWRETTVNSATTTVWVKVPSIAANSTATIYVYFGNSGAVAADDGANTMDFLEDFESNSLAGYTFGSGDSSSFETTVSFAHNGTYGLDAPTGHKGDRTNSGMYKTGSQTAQGKTIRYFQYVDASQQDEPCTLFGVQGSGSNYGVCLDEFPTMQFQIVKNITSNNGSGSDMATTSVTYSTGWYEVVIDWLTTNTINAKLYNSSGSQVASLSTTTSAYTSGGYGFSFWFQNGGWDSYMVKPYTAITPTYVFGGRQANGGATWKANEDTVLTGLQTLQNTRLRFSIQNSGSNQTNQLYRLQYAAKGGAVNCESVPTGNFLDVPTTSGGCGTDAACMKTSSQFTNLASTSPSLTYPGTMRFTAGNIMQDPSNQTTSLSLNGNTETETEYNFQMTSNAIQSAYCFRVNNGGTDLANYDRVAEADIAYSPFITNPNINNGQDIALTEGATTTIYATSTVTDYNGYTDMTSATGTIYRSGVSGGADCTASDNNCYQIASTSCTFTSCSGNSCTLKCRADIQYIAEPTDTGTYSAETWKARLSVQDSSSLRDTQTSGNVELLTLYALAISTGDIDFGALNVGTDTGAIDALTTLANTGNAKIDIQLQGTDLTNGAASIAVGQQKYATSTFTYASCSICQFLTGSASAYDVNIPKPTSTTTPQTSDIYWGINIPTGTAATSYSGVNTFIAVGG